jgi:hypothetical protein
LKRLVIFIVLIAVLLVAGRLWWGWYADRQLAALYADYHARGVPILPEDFQPKSLRNEENAAFYWMRAGGALTYLNPSPSNSNDEFASNVLPYPDAWFQLMDKSIAAYPQIYPDARVAAKLKQTNWGTKFKTPVLSNVLANMTPFTSARALANMLADTALYSHFHGDDAAALDYAAQVRALGRGLDQYPAAIAHLVAMGIDALILQDIELMAGNLTIKGVPGATNQSASRQQVQAMVNDLLDDQPNASSRLHGMQSERMLSIDSALWLSDGSWMLHPMFVLDGIRSSRKFDAVIKAAAQDTWPAAKAMLPPGPRTRLKTFPGAPTLPFSLSLPIEDDASHLYSSYAVWGVDKTVLMDFRTSLDRRMAAIALAMRLYRLDNGRYPASLADLTPQYLPAVPADPFAPDHAPIRYILADNGNRPVAFSVDEDGLQDTKGEESLPNFTCWGWQTVVDRRLATSKQKPMDQYRDLSQWMPRGTAATQPQR